MSKPKIAVGVRFRPDYPAPLILFKAKGERARLALELARKWKIPEQKNDGLAALLFELPEGGWIPFEHFAILAELLAAVYSMGKK